MKKLGGAHGFTEPEDATWVKLCVEEVEPVLDIVAFQEAVGGELASAEAVGTSVGEEDGEAVSDEELGVSGHADAVVGEAVEEKD